jgi:hypothetical protein
MTLNLRANRASLFFVRGEFRLSPHVNPRALARSRPSGCAGSNEYPLHLVERDSLGAAVVKPMIAPLG